ncbi:MAG TPA: M1 family aminopeptidase [Longimicrobiales bacterium]
MIPTLALALGAASAFAIAPGDGPSIADPAPGVSWELAQHRASTISDLHYALRFSIPRARSEPIRGHARIRLRLSDATAPLILDFRQPPDRLLAVRAGGVVVEHRTVNGHIVVPATALRPGENELDIEFIAGDEPLNRGDDFLYALFVPDRASQAFPSLDQPNLKARYRLTLEVPAEWKAVSNGALEGRTSNGAWAVFRFAETKPISTYLFSFAVGDFRVETALRGGRELHMYHRETDEEKLARNRDEIFDLQAAAIDWLERYTGIPYPFDKFDFVLIPAFQFGGMEHPGAIFYNASTMLLEASATQAQRLGRASLIAHETAHMWFGDLVTMNWFDDVWTKEVFANFMAAKIVNPSFPEIDHELRFLLSHYPAAYEVDRTEGANPIRQPLENLSEAGSLYGAIIYQKAPIVMKHLERLVGEETFREGLREYLRTYAYGNATWPDLIEILDRLSPEDLKSWSAVWVEEPGRPTVRTELTLEGGRIAALRFVQSDPRGRGRLWRQRLDVLLAYPDTTRTFPVQLDGPVAEVPEAVGLPAPDFVLADGRGVAYGLFLLDDHSRRQLLRHLPSIREPLVRGVAWITLWDAMLEGLVPPGELIDLGARALETETDELNVQRIVATMTRAYWRFLPPAERERRAPEVESLLWRHLERAGTPSRKSLFFRAYRSIALTPAGVERLRRIWRQDQEIPGLPIAEGDYTELALELAVREVDDWRTILDTQLARIENPDRRARFAFLIPALSADTAVRDSFFASLADPANRRREAWVLTAVSYLHHPLRAAHAERYVLPALELLEEIERTGDIFFPKRWLDATLGGHSSPRVAATVRRYLETRPDLPVRLREKLLQSADELFRAARQRERADDPPVS